MGIGVWILMILVAFIAYMAGVVFRRQEVVEPKAFGLEAFEDYGLGRASSDVLKAVVTIISYLGHPFTVIQEANEEKAMACSQEAGSRATIEKNVQAIRKLEVNNVTLDNRAKIANARATEMDALVAQVTAVVGK